MIISLWDVVLCIVEGIKENWRKLEEQFQETNKIVVNHDVIASKAGVLYNKDSKDF